MVFRKYERVSTVTDKKCSACQDIKPRTAFYKKQTRYDGLKNLCKTCDDAQGRERARAKYTKHSALVDDLKLQAGCADCGYRTHPAALHFDHLPGQTKTGGVARLTGWGTTAKLLAEIAKCEVVCANCHAVRTAGRRPTRLPHEWPRGGRLL